MVENGVIHGRFQIFHLKHMEYVLAAKMHCKRLFIGITHPDARFRAVSPRDIHGTTRRDNPMTYYERMEMIQRALADFGVKREEYEVVPFPVTRPDLIAQYLPADSVHYLGIYDDWGRERARLLKEQGLPVEILWEKPAAQRGVVSTDVRTCIEQGEDWQELVPRAVYDYIREKGIDARIRSLAKKGFLTGEEL